MPDTVEEKQEEVLEPTFSWDMKIHQRHPPPFTPGWGLNAELHVC